MYIITIDSGTSNTRVKVWCANKVIAEAFNPVGVRDTAISGTKQKLMAGVRNAISQALVNAKINQSDITAILAAGMITSNVGLYEVPHLNAPAGRKELARGMVKATIPEVNDQPIWFVPGIKNSVPEFSLDNCEQMDIMRGEEAEVIGLIEKLAVRGPAVLILPGSHSKIVSIDDDNRISGCVTTIAGELLDVIINNTILANALKNSFASEINERMLLKGADYSGKVGLGRTCFLVRILDMFGDLSLNDKGNFILGAVLSEDILAIKKSDALKVKPDMPIIVTGKKMLKEALAVLIKKDGFFKGDIQVVDDNQDKDLSGVGVLAVARERGIIN